MSRSRAWFGRCLPVLLALTAPLGAGIAQEDTTWSSRTLTGTSRVALGSSLDLKESGTWSLNGSLVSFLAGQLQAGVTPQYSRIDLGSRYEYFHVLGQANLLLPFGGRSHLYAGGFVASSDVTDHEVGRGWGWQVGGTRFLQPALGVRAEFRRSYGETILGEQNSALTIGLDPYIFGRASAGAFVPPSLGAVDVDFSASANWSRFDQYNATGSVAPFLTSWSQVGMSYTYYGLPHADATYTTVMLSGRLYLPILNRVRPFVEGSVEHASEHEVEYDHWLTAYGGRAGLRVHLNRSVGIDLGARRRLVSNDRRATNGVLLGPESETRWFAGVVKTVWARK